MIYKYNTKKENEFIGAFASNDDGHIPFSFTDIEPPLESLGDVRIFNVDSQSWSNITDYRLKNYYRKSDRLKVKWSSVYEPNPSFLGAHTEIEPPNGLLNAIWDESLNNWREMSDDEIYQDKVSKVTIPTLEYLDTLWAYDLQSQWALQVAENQRNYHDRKVICFDVWGNEHRISIYKSNALQKKMFDKYLTDKGVSI